MTLNLFDTLPAANKGINSDEDLVIGCLDAYVPGISMKNQALDSTAFVRSTVTMVSTLVPSRPFVTRTPGTVVSVSVGNNAYTVTSSSFIGTMCLSTFKDRIGAIASSRMSKSASQTRYAFRGAGVRPGQAATKNYALALSKALTAMKLPFCPSWGNVSSSIGVPGGVRVMAAAPRLRKDSTAGEGGCPLRKAWLDPSSAFSSSLSRC
ncbi:hypothetical protein BKA60DRAFT_588116 [Fusarium oxysporum]|nr:hypothetical protein BKA60DRAFT_588116 [Fusarium oxysporum]